VRRRTANPAGAGFARVSWLSPGDADRLTLAIQFGADLAVDVVDVTAKAPTALTQAIALARPAATVIVAGRAALGLLISGRYPFENLPRRCVRLEDSEELLVTMADESDGVPPVHGVLTHDISPGA
jgi:alcohol dehydrogenase